MKNQFTDIPMPVTPEPETREERAVVAHINTWRANRERDANREIPDPPEAA